MGKKSLKIQEGLQGADLSVTLRHSRETSAKIELHVLMTIFVDHLSIMLIIAEENLYTNISRMKRLSRAKASKAIRC